MENILKDKTTLKYKRIDMVIDYLFEKGFEMDKEISINENEYKYLFGKLYDMFEENNIQDSYYETMINFLLFCLVNNDQIDMNILISNMSIINKYKQNRTLHFVGDELENIKKILTKKRVSA